MEIGLVLGLLKVVIETFHDERRDRFTKKYVGLEKEWHEEKSKPVFDPQKMKGKKYDARDFRSDLALDRILFELEALIKLVISERDKNNQLSVRT